MTTSALMILLLAQGCHSFRNRLTLGKNALDLDLVSGPDFSKLLAEASNTCGGKFLPLLKQPTGSAVVTYAWDKVLEPIDQYLVNKKTEIDDLNLQIEQVMAKIAAAEKKTASKPKLPDTGKIAEMVGELCTHLFKDDYFAEGSTGTEACVKVKCGLDGDNFIEFVPDKGPVKWFEDQYAGDTLSKYDMTSIFLDECNKAVPNDDDRDQEDETSYGMESSWCPNMCKELANVVNKYGEDSGSADQAALDAELVKLNDEFKGKTMELTQATQDQAQCKKMKSNVGVFVEAMTGLGEAYSVRAKERQKVQWQQNRAAKRLERFKKNVEKVTEKEEEAQKDLDDKKAEEKRISDLVDEQKKKEDDLLKKIEEEDRITQAAENDLLLLTEAQNQVAIFKSKLSFALLQMYLLYELSIIQPLETLLSDAESLQNQFVDPNLIMIETNVKGGETAMIDDIERMLRDLKNSCEKRYLPSLRKIELVDYRLVLPSIGSGSYNETRLSDKTKELIANMPEDVKDIIYPDGFLAEGGPFGLPDMCTSPEIAAIEVTSKQVLDVIEARRQEIIEAFIKILTVNTHAIEQKATTENIISVDKDVHDCQHEPDGLKKFALIFGDINFYINYASLWGHLRSGGLSYFLLLEAQLNYLFIVASERAKHHHVEQAALSKEMVDVLAGKEELVKQLKQASEDAALSEKAHNAVAKLLDQAKNQYDKQEAATLALIKELEEANKRVKEALDNASAKHQEAIKSHNGSLLDIAMKTMLKADSQMGALTAADVSDAATWAGKVTELRTAIAKIKKEAVFLPPF